eukprot:TRINITY_DN36319_c0_g1_i1.p2 TRINITY_DN36319_c0_g1~~TRINITY_DN36319_c0_g1_i1.p2  ORF type:complete len:105 (-),score=20.81 TRINITY_DN36319_c0_g1_i1:405-719(-)
MHVDRGVASSGFQGGCQVQLCDCDDEKCPKCKTDIEKDGGCLHMHCSRCKSDFCWKCLLPYKDHQQCRKEEEVVGDKREIEAEVNDGMSEKERFRCFRETFRKM